MKKRIKLKYNTTNLRLVMNIIPAFLIVFVVFFFLARSMIIELSTSNLSARSQNYADKISAWAGEVLNELSIYKDYVDKMGIDKDKKETFDFLKTSYQKIEACPYGLYWADKDGNYFDSSEWVPPKDYVGVERNWYIEGVGHGTFKFGEPYIDIMTGDRCVSVTVSTGTGEKEGVLSADVYLDYVSRLVTEISEEDVETAFFATEGKQEVIAGSDELLTGKSLREVGSTLLYRNISELLVKHEFGLHSVHGADALYYVNICRVKNTNWSFVSIIKRNNVLLGLRKVEIVMLIVTVIAATYLTIVLKKLIREFSTAERKAKTDPLTNILNRDGFQEMVTAGMETYPNQGILLIMDMDNFKRINDQLGHPEGDKVLKEFALLLDEYFNRNKDIVARIGGDEFSVFVGREVTESEAESMLKKFIQIFHDKFDETYSAQELSISIGGTFNSGDLKFTELYKKADSALYKVKESGKNNFEIVG